MNLDMNNDKAIAYMGKLQNVKNNLSKLKRIGFNITKLEKTLSKLETEVETGIADIYDKFDREDSKMFLHDSVLTLYQKALKRLDKINFTIEEEYNSYYIINAQYEHLTIELKEFTNDNIEPLVKEAIDLLVNLKSSSNIDHNEEGNLVEKVYALIYRIIKLEQTYSNESTLFDLVKSDETDCSFIAALITDNMKEIPEESEHKVYKIRKELEKEGIADSVFVSKKLLQAIIEVEGNSKASCEKFEEIVTEYINLKEDSLSTKMKHDSLEKKYEELKKNKKKCYHSVLRKRLFNFMNVTLIAGGILTSGFVLKKNITEKVYKEYTMTYDSSTDKTTTTEGGYSKDVSDIKITEYSPWDNPGFFRDNYQRTKYTYEFKNSNKVILETPEEYLSINFKDNLEFTEKQESQKECPDDYGYQENKYIIVRTTHDLSNSKEQTNIILFIPAVIGTSLGLVGLGVLANFLLARKSVKKRREAYLDTRSDYNKTIKRLLEEKESLEKAKILLKNLKDKAEDEYNKLPPILRKTPKVKEKYLLLKEENNN